MLKKIAGFWRKGATERAADEEAGMSAEEIKLRGNRFLAAGDFDNAVACYRRALFVSPRYAEAYNNLGHVLGRQGHHAEARQCLEQAVAIDPQLANAHYNLASILRDQGHVADAMAAYRRTIALKPDLELAYLDLAHLQFRGGDIAAARQTLQAGLEHLPASADLHNYLGNVLQAETRLDEAVVSYRHCLALNPDFAEAHSNLGLVLQAQGQLDAAVACFRHALACKPDYALAHSNLIFAVDMAPGETTVSQIEERRRWDARFAAPLRQYRLNANVPDPERRLRIGYVSGDLRMHSASTVFDAMLTKFDRRRYEVFAYSNTGREDAVTRKFMSSVSTWRDISGMADDAVAETIRADSIDILVDLSGHSAGNRLPVFARKPAPIQVTAWGYATSTGMAAMDVFFADPVVVPPAERSLFVEEVRYLPCVACYTPPQDLPEVGALPVLETGRITFGSFNRVAKISDDTFRVWAQVLAAVPGSTMIIKAFDLESQTARERISAHFDAAGIERQRVVMLGKSTWPEHVAAFGRIDIALDPFPHGGGVTTFESLLMGVPVVTLRWPTIVGRLSASILTALGQTDWIAESAEQYIAIAVAKAARIEELAALRKELRGRLQASPLGDAGAYVAAVEREYRNLWREWCSGRQNAGGQPRS